MPDKSRNLFFDFCLSPDSPNYLFIPVYAFWFDQYSVYNTLLIIIYFYINKV